MFKWTNQNKDFDKQNAYKKKMFWAPFLGIAFRAYIPLTIASFLNLKYQFNNPKAYIGERIGDTYAIFIFFLSNILFPGAMLYTAFVPENKLVDPEFK